MGFSPCVDGFSQRIELTIGGAAFVGRHGCKTDEPQHVHLLVCAIGVEAVALRGDGAGTDHVADEDGDIRQTDAEESQADAFCGRDAEGFEISAFRSACAAV